MLAGSVTGSFCGANCKDSDVTDDADTSQDPKPTDPEVERDSDDQNHRNINLYQVPEATKDLRQHQEPAPGEPH